MNIVRVFFGKTIHNLAVTLDEYVKGNGKKLDSMFIQSLKNGEGYIGYIAYRSDEEKMRIGFLKEDIVEVLLEMLSNEDGKNKNINIQKILEENEKNKEIFNIFSRDAWIDINTVKEKIRSLQNLLDDMIKDKEETW